MRVAFTRQNATDSQDVRTQKPNQNRQVLPIGRDPTGYVPPDQHHFISPSRNSPIKLTEFLSQGRDDPALKVGSLQNYSRCTSNTDFTPGLQDKTPRSSSWTADQPTI